MAEFSPLDKFLRDSAVQLQSELYGLDFTKPEVIVTAAKLVAQINLLGTITQLPAMLKTVKDQLDQVEQQKQKRQADSYDPLNTQKGF